MKTDDVNRATAAQTQRGRLTDFLFVGVGIAPVALMLAGQPAPAFLLLIPLLLAACLCGAWEQVGAAGAGAAGPASRRERNTASPSRAAELTMRERAGPDRSRKA